MRSRWFIAALFGIFVLTTHPAAQSDDTPTRMARTVRYQSRDVIALRAKLRYTTLIVLPDGTDVMDVTCGDKDAWIVNARGPWLSVKPARAGIETNLHVLTTDGQVYAFVLTEISHTKGLEPDLTIYIEPEEGLTVPWASSSTKYVPADQIADFRAQVALAQDRAREAVASAESRLVDSLTAFRTTYPLTLVFPYRFKANEQPFLVRAIFHDDRFTYIQAAPRELPTLYEWKDGTPNLVNFEMRGGTYVIPKILDAGYLILGKQRLEFQRLSAGRQR
jgi:type IV secretion system protein VirB9